MHSCGAEMKIVKPSVTLGWVTGASAEVIEAAGRTAYKSEDQMTPESAGAFIRNLVKRTHDSVLEHACASMRIICDRGVSHEIVRHRLFSYTQESTRYCNYSQSKYGGEITVIEPPGLTDKQKFWWQVGVRDAVVAYLSLLTLGVTPQIARSVLPTCLKTEIVMTGNFRNWRHFLKLRMAPNAHPQIREIAFMVHDILMGVAPVVFEDLKREWE